MSREAQLEAVARDWCMTIRASQIIPVYPLMEDMQPGDIYLVQTTIDRQQEVYRKKGFLPLDNHIARLHPTGYEPFYSHSFFAGDASGTPMPARWSRKASESAAWSPAPHAAFPTYSFSVRKGAGLNLAVPISGVPVGMSLMGTQAADGSVAIKQARTMGLDSLSLFGDLNKWAEQNREFLRPFAPGSGSAPRNYLRVVSRVYSTGAVSVALSDARSFAGGADVGMPRPVDLVDARLPTGRADVGRATIDNYRGNLSALNAMLAESQRPSRLSGTNAGLDSAATDAKTKAKLEALEADLQAKKAALAAADAELVAKSAPAAEAEDKVRTAQAALAEAEAALRAAGDDQLATAEAALEQAKTAVAEAEANAAQPRAELAAATGRAEVARQALSAATGLIPGGSLRVTAASSRFIAMEETFATPLIIGYLGFDVPILEGGAIGAPVPTHSQIDSAKSRDAEFQPEQVVRALYAKGVDNRSYQRLKAASESDSRGAEAVALLDALAGDLPAKYTVYEQSSVAATIKQRTETIDQRNYLAFKDYRGALASSLDTLDRAMKPGTQITIDLDTGKSVTVKSESKRWAQLLEERDEFQKHLANPEVRAAHERACIRAGSEYLRLVVADSTGR